MTAQDEVATPAAARMQVFISYSHEPQSNAAFVRDLAGRLTVAGFSVWLDEEQISGGEFEEGILAAARESEVALFVVTERWAKRPWTRQEVRLFGERVERDGVRLVVVAREQVDTAHLGAYLAGLHRITWLADDEEPDARFWQTYCSIVSAPPGPRTGWAEKGRAVAAGGASVREEEKPSMLAPRRADKPNKSNDTTALPCEGKPADVFQGDDHVFVVTDLDEWIGIGAEGFHAPVARLSNALSCIGASAEGLLVGTCDPMVARLCAEGWEYLPLPSPALALWSASDGSYAGTASGTILRLNGAHHDLLCQLRDPIVALAAYEDSLLAIGAQGLFGQVSLAAHDRGEVTWLGSGNLGRPVGFFPTTEGRLVGVIGSTRLGVIDPATRIVTVCAATFDQGIEKVEFLGPQRWPYAVLTDVGELSFVNAALDGMKPAPLPPGAVVAGCCGLNGRGLATAWTREGRLYRMAAIDQPAECIVEAGVLLAAPMIGQSKTIALLWDDASGGSMKMVAS